LIAMEDVIRERPVIERKREWKHGAGGLGADCPRSRKPVYTDPQKLPDQCRDWACRNDEWRSRGIVERDANSREILSRDGKREVAR
jgi:hypothetical protein